MGCGCGKNKNLNQKSSRMPAAPPKRVGNISVPGNMTPNQRRSTVAKIKNDRNPHRKQKQRINELIKQQRIQRMRDDRR